MRGVLIWRRSTLRFDRTGVTFVTGGKWTTYREMAEDVVTFLTWAGDPHMEARKQMGVMVLMYLFIFAVLVYLAYRQVWRNVKH